ncbi:Lcl C-terminal domain-containing protein [Sulfurospirillum sp.]|jgi:hypothetical protein|uniref:Lcl C-terminal domain-containing protein n=1 Tax=Sulfurospirillum sp. TaxID=2053622 RepID=UPI002FDD322A
MKRLLFFFLATLSLMAECSFKTSTLVTKESEVVDKKSGLIWRRCSLGQEWQKGKGCVGDVAFLRHSEVEEQIRLLGKNWRLPSIDELLTLVDKRCKSPMINTVLFGKLHDTGEGANYISSSIYLEGDEVLPTLFYTINYIDGSVDAHTKGYMGAVRLVR